MIEFHQYEGVICQVHSRQSFEILGTIILIFFQLCHLQKTTTIIMKYKKDISKLWIEYPTYLFDPIMPLLK